MPTPDSKPTYIETDGGAVFAIFQPPDPAAQARQPVLVCPPWGWAEVASYRSRREWARRLAAIGHPTLRFALPATGNSSGSPRDAALVTIWVAAVAAAARWLRDAAGAPAVTALGLGLGGLLARAAVLEGAPIEELILWAAPVSGRSFARETRAFSRMQAWNGSAGGAPPGVELPDGWLEAGGFVLSAETLTELTDLAPDPATGPAPRRALLLERDGVAVDEGLRAGLEAAGADVTVAPGSGWADLVSHAEHTKLPVATAARVAEWLAAAPATPGSHGSAAPAGDSEEMTLAVDGAMVRERPFFAGQEFGRGFGILAEPVSGPVTDACAVFLNAGAVRNVGPNRLWVETARRWAAHGVPTLRLDLEGIGEADGESPPRVCDFYRPKYQRQLAAVLDQLQQLGAGERFVLVGLCAGGYWAFREAVEDRRVSSVVLLNSGALAWDDDLIAQREARKLGRASQRQWWGRLLRGEVGIRRVGSLLWALVSAGRRALRRLVRRRPVSLQGEIEADLGRLRQSGTRLTLAFSAEEGLAQELDGYGIADEFEHWPQMSLVDLPAGDHTLRPVAAQAAAHELLERELQLLLG